MINEAQAFELIRPILAASVTDEENNPTEEDLLREAEALRQAIDQLARQEDQETIERERARPSIPPGITGKAVLDHLRDEAAELVRDYIALREYDDGESGTPLSTAESKRFTFYRFVKDVAFLPPVPMIKLKRALDVDERTIRRFYRDGDRDYIRSGAKRLLDGVIDRCRRPEQVSDEVPDAPLKSFDDLRFLGSLRYALTDTYRRSEPTPAQARFIPGVLKAMRPSSDSPARVTVLSPTNSGKNGIILATALGAIAHESSPVMVLQPHRAQIDESLRTWSRTVARRAIERDGEIRALRLAGSSSLRTRADRDIVAGKRHLVTIIPEKLTVLARGTQIDHLCKVLIADELILLFDPERGPKLEILLTLAREADLPIVALGAAVAEKAGRKIAGWLAGLDGEEDPIQSGHLQFDPDLKRSPPIEYEIQRSDGAWVSWTEANGQLNGDGDGPLSGHDWKARLASLVIKELQRAPHRQILVFVESRSAVVEVAAIIAGKLGEIKELKAAIDAAAEDDLAQWRASSLPEYGDPGDWQPLDFSIMGQHLGELLNHRVGVHSRDLPGLHLQRVEEGFRSGHLRVMCATTTVQAGINLPVDTVIQSGLRTIAGARQQGRKDLPLPPSTLEQRLGRAGRTLFWKSGGAGEEEMARGIVYIDEKTMRIDTLISQRILAAGKEDKSVMTGDHLCLLLLLALGDDAKTVQELSGTVGLSYFAYSYSMDESACLQATRLALQRLRKDLLIEADTVDEPRKGGGEIPGVASWRATALGRALAGGLLLPREAKGIERIVDAALAGEQEPGSETWAVNVMLAACQTPQIVDQDYRPRDTDITTPAGEDRRRRVSNWVHRQDGELKFGLPGSPRMPVTGLAAEVVRRLDERRPRKGDIDAILRTYVAWLWANAYPINLSKSVESVEEHNVEQDLAYYLSHIVRVASWLAEYKDQYVVSMHLDDLSVQLASGVPAFATEVKSIFRAWIDRATATEWAASPVPLPDHVDHLAGLTEDDKERIRSDIKARSGDRWEAALDAAKEELNDQERLVLRMTSPKDVVELLGRVWPSVDPVVPVVDGNMVVIGELSIEFCDGPIGKHQQPTGDFVLSNVWLSHHLAAPSSECEAALMGPEEFVRVLRALSYLPEVGDRMELLKRLAATKKVCAGRLIDSISKQVQYLRD